MVEKNSCEKYHRYMQDCSTSQNIFIVNMFYKLDCVEQNCYLSHKYMESGYFVVIYWHEFVEFVVICPANSLVVSVVGLELCTIYEVRVRFPACATAVWYTL